MLVLYRTRNPFLSSAWTAHSSITSVASDENGLSAGENVDNIRGRIEDAYHDEVPREIEGQAPSSQPKERGRNGSEGRGMLVQPSRLQDEGNEWREG